MTDRCPDCHLAYIPEETIKTWLEKFDTPEYPHYNILCNLCDKPAGKHISPNWKCPQSTKEGATK